MNTLTKRLTEFQDLKIATYGKDFLLTWEKTDDEIRALTLVAECFYELHKAHKPFRVFDAGLAVSIFPRSSPRGRGFAFAIGRECCWAWASRSSMRRQSQIAHGETVRETANMISFLTEVIGIRDDMFIGEGHEYMRESRPRPSRRASTKACCPAADGHQFAVRRWTTRRSRWPICCDLQRTFGSLDACAAKKIAMTWAYSPSYGKPLSVAAGVIVLDDALRDEASLAYPEGYGLIPEVVELAKQNSRRSGGGFEVVSSMEKAFERADVVYAKSWAPYHVMQRRTPLLHQGDKEGLKDWKRNAWPTTPGTKTGNATRRR